MRKTGIASVVLTLALVGVAVWWAVGAPPAPAAVAKAPPEQAAWTPPPRDPSAASGDADYRRLVEAKSPDAYPLVERCLMEHAIATGPYHVQPVLSRCTLEPGTWQDRRLRREAVRAYALAARFAAVEYVYNEGPNGRYQAFADDRRAFEKLVDDTARIGIKRNEPVALIGEAIEQRRLADVLAFVGLSQRARDAYMESLAMKVASAAGLAMYNAAIAAGSSVVVEPYDPKRDPEVKAYPLSEADRLSAINDGLNRAELWMKGS